MVGVDVVVDAVVCRKGRGSRVQERVTHEPIVVVDVVAVEDVRVSTRRRGEVAESLLCVCEGTPDQAVGPGG